MKISTQLERLERKTQSSEFDKTVKAISQIMDECAAEAMGGEPAKAKESLVDILESANAKDD